MSFSRTFAIVLRQYYLIRGSFARFIPLFVWVAVDMILWGFITKYLNQVSASGLNFVPTLLGAVLLWDFFTRVMQGVTMAFFEDVWSRNFLNIFASPLSIAEYANGLVLSSVATSLVGLLVMLLLSTAVFGLNFFSYGLPLIPFLLVLFLFGIALGILAVSMVLRLGPASEWLIWPIPFIIAPFVGVYYPLSTLPHWMQWIGHFLPPSYVFEGIRAIASGVNPSGKGLMLGLAISLLDVLLACWVFMRTHRRAVRTGLIARYSAESVS